MKFLDKLLGIDKKLNEALLKAAEEGHTDVVKTLLAHGADINTTDKDGWAALSRAAYNGHTAVVKLLLAHGAIESHQFGDLFMQLGKMSDVDIAEELYRLIEFERETKKEVIRAIGEYLCRNGGNKRMQRVGQYYIDLGGIGRSLEYAWIHICGWLP